MGEFSYSPWMNEIISRYIGVDTIEIPYLVVFTYGMQFAFPCRPRLNLFIVRVALLRELGEMIEKAKADMV